MNLMIEWLVGQSSVQMLGVWLPGVRNDVADALSRGRASEVLGEVEAMGVHIVELQPRRGAAAMLRRALAAPLRS